MSGTDGFREGCSGRFKKLASFWRMRREHVTGAAIRGNAVHIVRMKEDAGEWLISDCATLRVSDCPGEGIEDLAAEKLATAFRTMGWAMAPVSLCLTADEVFHDSIHIPPMPEEEKREAVRWDIEGRGIFAGDEFLFDFLGSTDANECQLTAMRKANADIWRRALEKCGLELAALTAMPKIRPEMGRQGSRRVSIGDMRFRALDDVQEEFLDGGGWDALLAAAAVCFPGGSLPNLLRGDMPTEPEDWNWPRLAASVLAATAILIFGLFLVDQVQLAAAEDAAAEQRSRLALLGREREQKSRLEKCAEETEKKQRTLAVLSKKAFPWRSTLAHFGTMAVEGVCLTQIEQIDGQVLRVRGEAESYDALAEFLKKFETDREFFQDGPTLTESHVETGNGRPGAVDFTVELRPA